MSTVYVSRDGSGKVSGIFANPQPGFAEEALASDNAAVLAYLAPPVPASVTPYQARCALLNAGLLDGVNAAVTAAGGSMALAWEYATMIERSSSFIAAMQGGLGLSDAQVDALFVAAAAIT